MIVGRPRNPPPATGAELEALEAAWAERGPDAIRVVRHADPSAYVRLMCLAVEIEGDLATAAPAKFVGPR